MNSNFSVSLAIGPAINSIASDFSKNPLGRAQSKKGSPRIFKSSQTLESRVYQFNREFVTFYQRYSSANLEPKLIQELVDKWNEFSVLVKELTKDSKGQRTMACHTFTLSRIRDLFQKSIENRLQTDSNRGLEDGNFVGFQINPLSWIIGLFTKHSSAPVLNQQSEFAFSVQMIVRDRDLDVDEAIALYPKVDEEIVRGLEVLKAKYGLTDS